MGAPAHLLLLAEISGTSTGRQRHQFKKILATILELEFKMATILELSGGDFQLT